MRKRNILVHRKSFELIKLRFVRRIGRLVTEDFTRRNDARRRAVLFEPADLYRRGVRPQELSPFVLLPLYPKGVPHIP